MNTVAIHQPNFFPWLGYFNKIARSDVFIFLDDVQMPKTGGVWTNRVMLLQGGQAKWATAPLDRNFHGVRNVNESTFISNHPWREKLTKTLVANYGGARYFNEVMEFIEPYILNSEQNIARYNIEFIVSLAGRLGISKNRFQLSSGLSCAGHSNELLISLVQRVKGNVYLCGGGAGDYQNDAQFAKSGIKVVHQNFSSPHYSQHGTEQYVAGLSIIDMLMNCGFVGVTHWLSSDIC